MSSQELHSAESGLKLVFKSELTNGKELRVIGTSGEPWFVAKDIAEFLEYKDTTTAITDNVDEEDKITFENSSTNNINK